MTDKCDLCKNKIESTFLEKIKGTYVGRGKNKKVVCASCQKKHKGNVADEFI